MKASLCSIIVATAILVPLNANGNEHVFIRDTLRSLFSLLQSGNTVALEPFIEGKLHKRKEDLLKHNQKYSKFLREYYKGATFKVNKITKEDDKAFIDASVIFPDGTSEQFLLRVAKKPGQGIWKIVEDIPDPEEQ